MLPVTEVRYPCRPARNMPILSMRQTPPFFLFVQPGVDLVIGAPGGLKVAGRALPGFVAFETVAMLQIIPSQVLS